MRAELVFWYCLYYALWLCPDHTKDDLNNKHVKSSGTAQIINHKIRLSTSLFGNTQYDIIDEDKQKNVNYSLYSRYTSAYAVCFHLEMQKKNLSTPPYVAFCALQYSSTIVQNKIILAIQRHKIYNKQIPCCIYFFIMKCRTTNKRCRCLRRMEPIYFAVIKILSAVCLHNAICTVM